MTSTGMLSASGSKATSRQQINTNRGLPVPTSTVWISYDLGVRGDYEGLYVWLDTHRAKECGDSLAVLSYRYQRSLPDELREDLKRDVAIDKRTRIYLIYRERTTNKNKGQFLFGGAAAWTGYASSDSDTVDNED
jgi:hypothetical protein